MRSISLLGLLLLSILAVAQDRSIQFETISFQEALDKAKQSDKILFVDCYTSWCGPCKMLAKEVFTNNEVADYFNEHFISLKVDCEKGEGPELSKRFGVSGFPTLLFLDGKGELVNKIVGASPQPVFLQKVKAGFDPATSLYSKEKQYEAGNHDRAFVLDLIVSYKRINDSQKAKKVSLELLSTLDEKEVLTKEMWEVVRYYYVSTYGSQWWKFILDHKEDYSKIVGKEAIAAKIGETMHPYLFGFTYGRKKAENKQDFKTYKALIDEYQPRQKETLYAFIKLGESASFDNFNGYFKTLLKVIPKIDISEYYRFYTNALPYLMKNVNEKQKQQLLDLMKGSQEQSNDYFKPFYEEFYQKMEKYNGLM